MSHVPSDSQKQKRSQTRPWGCLRVLLIPIFLAAACYSGMWVLARYGGDWAISDQFPVPPESQAISASYNAQGFIVKNTVYVHSWTPEDLRIWFEQADILFLLKCGAPSTPKDEHCYEFGARDYGRQLKQRETARLVLYRASIGLTLSPTLWNYMGWDNMQTMCASVSIYGAGERDEFAKLYPNLEIPEGKTAFVTANCWPNDVVEFFTQYTNGIIGTLKETQP
jgi:hypothetical protein